MPSALSFDSSKPFTLVLSYKPDVALIPTGIFPILVAQLYPATVVNPALLGYAASAGPQPALRLDSMKNTFTNVGTFLRTPNTNIATNTDWHTVIFSWDGINTVSLTDYNLTTTITTTQTASFVALPNCVPGSCPTHTIIGYGFNGIIDDVKFWGRLLTPAEITTIKTFDSPCCP
jgi:hypothetical protein